MSTETVDLLETGAQDVHLDFNTAPELWMKILGGGILFKQECC